MSRTRDGGGRRRRRQELEAQTRHIPNSPSACLFLHDSFKEERVALETVSDVCVQGCMCVCRVVPGTDLSFVLCTPHPTPPHPTYITHHTHTHTSDASITCVHGVYGIVPCQDACSLLSICVLMVPKNLYNSPCCVCQMRYRQLNMLTKQTPKTRRRPSPHTGIQALSK